MATPEPSPDLQRWSRRYSITTTSLKAIMELAHAGPTVPPFTGLPEATRRELRALSLQALTELRELTEEYLTQTHPPTEPTSSPSQTARDGSGAKASPVGGPGRQPRSAWPAMDAVPEALWIEDVSAEEHPVVYVNQAFTDVTGYARERVLGAALTALQKGLTDPPADAALRSAGSSTVQAREAARHLQAVVTERRSGAAQIVIRHAEGYLLHAQVTLAPVTESDAEVIHYVGVLRSLR